MSEIDNDIQHMEFNIGGKVITLQFDNFEDTVFVEQDILKIEYSNLLGESLVHPVILNRVGILRAEAENLVNIAKLKMEEDIADAEDVAMRYFRDEVGIKNPTVKQCENRAKNQEHIKEIKRAYYKAYRDFKFIESLYWAAKSKDGKLDILAKSISPKEFESLIVEKTINNIQVKAKEALIK